MLGLETEVEIASQVDFATFNTTARQKLNVYRITGGQTRSRPQDNILNGGMNNLSDPTQPAPGLPEHRIEIEAPLCINQLGYWLRAFFGAPVTDDSGDPDFEHLFKSGVTTLPILSIQQKRQSGDFVKHLGCVGESFRIKLDPEQDGFARVMMSFIGISETPAGSAAAGTVAAAPTLDRPAERLANILYNSVAGGQVMSGEINFKRKLKRIRSADATGLPRAIQYDGKSELTGSLHCRYDSMTMLNDARADTERAIVLELLKSAARGYRMTLAHGLLDEVPVGADGPDGVEIDIPLTGFQNSSDPALQILALSAVESFATL